MLTGQRSTFCLYSILDPRELFHSLPFQEELEGKGSSDEDSDDDDSSSSEEVCVSFGYFELTNNCSAL
jgi:hypothetical protein